MASAVATSSAAASGPAVLGDLLYSVKPHGQGPDITFAMAVDGSRPLRRLYAPAWMADLSPDGRTIAFTSSTGDSMDIFTMAPDGSNVQRLTGNDFPSFHPIWSPDGSQIVYAGFPGEIWLTNADGSNQKRIATNSSMGVWSPDGKLIAYVGPPGGVWVMNPDGSNPRDLTPSDNTAGLPSWSPDGKKIVYNANATGNGDIKVMNADGSNATLLTTDADIEESPVWSPDGTQIVYVRRTSDQALSDLWIMNADGSNQQDLTNSPDDNDSTPSWR